MRGHIISYSSAKKARETQHKQLLEQIKLMEDRHRKRSSTEDEIKLKEKRLELHRICALEIDRLMMFTQQESYDTGPKSQNILACKLKRQMKKACITK